MTLRIEVGEIGRFKRPAHFASYSRLVDSQRASRGKKKGDNNPKCGNEYLAWVPPLRDGPARNVFCSRPPAGWAQLQG